MATFVMRVWLPDRPGALGAVASRIGSVGGDVVGIEILERGAGRAIDELVVELSDPDRLDLMIGEMHQVDGLDVESVEEITGTVHDPRLDALETAAILVGAMTADESIDALCEHAVRTIGCDWGAVIDLDSDAIESARGAHPTASWLAAFVGGSQSAARDSTSEAPSADDVVWAPMPMARMALVLGRIGGAFRARERRQVAALARIVDTRFRDLSIGQARPVHPSSALY